MKEWLAGGGEGNGGEVTDINGNISEGNALSQGTSAFWSGGHLYYTSGNGSA